MKRIMVLDFDKCSGCGCCELACSLEKEGLFNPLISRIGLIKIDEISITVPVICQQCVSPLCEDACPTNALSRDEVTGALVINYDVCIGCRMCLHFCPLGGIALHKEKELPIKCDLCDGDPACVKVCSYGALSYLDITQASLTQRRRGINRLSRLIAKVVE